MAGRTNAMTSQNTHPRASIGITILLPPFLARLGGWASICDVSMPRRHDASMSRCFAVPMSQTFNFSMCECLESSTLWGPGRWGPGAQAPSPGAQAPSPGPKPQAPSHVHFLSKLLWKAAENHPNVGDPPWCWALHNFNAMSRGGQFCTPPS